MGLNMTAGSINNVMYENTEGNETLLTQSDAAAFE